VYVFFSFFDSWAFVLPKVFAKNFFAYCDFWMAQIVFFLKLGVHFYHMVTSIFDCSYIVDVFLCISCIFVKKLLILDGFSVFGSFSVEKEKPW